MSIKSTLSSSFPLVSGQQSWWLSQTSQNVNKQWRLQCVQRWLCCVTMFGSCWKSQLGPSVLYLIVCLPVLPAAHEWVLSGPTSQCQRHIIPEAGFTHSLNIWAPTKTPTCIIILSLYCCLKGFAETCLISKMLHSICDSNALWFRAERVESCSPAEEPTQEFKVRWCELTGRVYDALTDGVSW